MLNSKLRPPKVKKILILFLLFAIGGELLAQGKDYLLVYKPGKKKRYHYYIGQEIIIKPVHNFPTLKGVITGFSDSAIYFGSEDSVHFSSIDRIVVNEDPRVFSKNLWLTNLVVSTGTIGLWELMYLVNTGDLSPDVKTAPAIIAFVTVTPLLVNGIAILVSREECPIGEGDWKLGTVIMPK